MYQYEKKGPKRGVALYSYSAEFGLTKTLEDCFEDLCDMGAHGIEILANTHIDNYPYPTDAWVEEWFRLCEKYEVVPVEYGNWIDSHVLGDRDLTTEESVEMLSRDIRLAHRLGFTVMRTKMPVINEKLEPVENWRDIIRGALPLAEQLNMKMCPEMQVRTPMNIPSQMATSVHSSVFSGSRMARISRDIPLFEMAITMSPRQTIPRSPWTASAALRKIACVPVEASDAASLCPMIPVLPIPVITTFPDEP